MAPKGIGYGKPKSNPMTPKKKKLRRKKKAVKS